MPLSTLPTNGPTIPAGAKQVSIKQLDVTATTQKEDVTTLESEEREYAPPCLVDAGENTATATCSANGLKKSGTTLVVTPPNVTTGWICEDFEETFEAGKYATWSANWSYYPAEE